MLNIQCIVKSAAALGGAMVLGLSLQSCAMFGGKGACASAGCVSDAQVAAGVQSSLDRHPELGPPGQIRVAALNQVVYLYGTVSNDLQRAVAKSVALESSGGDKIVNSIQVNEK